MKGVSERDIFKVKKMREKETDVVKERNRYSRGGERAKDGFGG